MKGQSLGCLLPVRSARGCKNEADNTGFPKNVIVPTIGRNEYGDHYVNCGRYPEINKGQQYRCSKNPGNFAFYVGEEGIGRVRTPNPCFTQNRQQQFSNN